MKEKEIALREKLLKILIQVRAEKKAETGIMEGERKILTSIRIENQT
jgi:hypothetical protein